MIDTKALRQKILDMAIKGKLVPQNPDDEPASVLLERIRAEKQQLIKEGKIKKDKNDSIIYKGDDNRYYEKVGSEVKDITDELPFEIPDNWVWTRLESSVLINPRNDLSDNIDVSFVEMKSISDGYNNHFSATTRLWKEVKSGFTHFQDGDVGFAKITPCFQNRKSVVFSGLQNGYGAGTTELHILRAVKSTITTEYLLLFVKSSYLIERGIQKFSGTAGQQRFGTDEVKKTPFPLPPLEEQARIVNRIDELFEQIDIIEKNQADIDALYDEFRKRTLTLAIQGKLVPQNPNDEPASVLLERIRAKKKAKLGKKYVDSYIYKGDDNYYYEKVGETVTNISDEISFELPENWTWCRLQTICSYIHRGKSPTYGTEKILPIIAQKCNQWAGIQTQKCLFADRATIAKYTEEQYLCVGDIIINSTGSGTVGRTGYIDDTLFKEYPKFVADSHVTVVRPLKCINSRYIYLFLKSPVIQTDIEAKCSGSTNQIELATKTIQSYLIPIPPAMEQHRIVSMFFSLEAKVKDEG